MGGGGVAWFSKIARTKWLGAGSLLVKHHKL